MENSEIRLGIIGIGPTNMASTLVLACAESDLRYRITGICGGDAHRVADTARQFEIPYWTDDYRELVGRDDVDVVCVFSPDHLHAEHCIAALEHQKHVVCTKPMVTAIEDARRLVSLVRDNKRKFLVGQTMRFDRQFIAAKRMLDDALGNPHFERYGGPRARLHFERSRSRAAALLNEDKAKPEPDSVETAACASGFHQSYVQFCASRQLFLNFCLHCRRCDEYCHDNLGFSLITGIYDETSFVRLSRVINDAKEAYAFARLQLFQAIKPPFDTLPFDRLTSYVDNLDYAAYGVRVASVKQAFGGAYNILDRIAHFLNDYLSLGVENPPRVTFTTNGWVWRDRNQNALRPELLTLRNPHLYALYDLARDLDTCRGSPEQDGYYGRLRRTRNALTHEYLMLHVEGMHWTAEADSPRLHMRYHDLVGQTVELLGLVRAAVIYLIALIDAEENKRRQATSGLIGPMPVSGYDAALFDPALDL